MPETPPASLLEVRDLAVRLGDRAIVEGFGMTLQRGEAVALMGPSGSGKTTLLRALLGLVDARGAVLLHGEPIADDDYPDFRRRCVWVSQRPVMPEGTVEDVLRRPFAYRSARGEFSSEKAASLLDAVGLDRDLLDDVAIRLSEGQQQRVSLVRALLLEPDALLLDEPTSSLDETSASQVEDLLRSVVRKRGLALLLVTHDRAFAERLCDRVIDLGPHLLGTIREAVASGERT